MNKIEIENNSDFNNFVRGEIEVNGHNYKFKVFVKKENKIDNSNTWETIAEEATKIALKLINKKALYKATVVFSGIPNQIDANTSDLNPRIKSAKVKETKKSKEYKQFKKISKRNDFSENIKNIKNALLDSTKTKKTRNNTQIPIIKGGDDNGRCLDKSIAYQILSKGNRGLGTETKVTEMKDMRVENVANDLRHEAAEIIRNPDCLKNDDFLPMLLSSIQDAVTKSKEAVKLLLGSEENIKNIEAILVKNNRTTEEIQTLRNLYADYIEQRDSNNVMNNYLDSAFLYVLPQLNNSYQYAILQDNAVVARYPKNTEFKIDNCIFLEFDGKNHYNAIDVEAGKEQLTDLVQSHNKEIVDQLFKHAHGSSASVTKNYLLDTIQHQMPKTYEAAAHLIYKYDLEKRHADTNTDKLPMPGTTMISYDGRDYQPGEYGDYRLQQIEADEFQKLLADEEKIKILLDQQMQHQLFNKLSS